MQATPLHHAACNGHTETVALLVKSGANVNMKDDVSSGALLCINDCSCIKSILLGMGC